MPVNNKEEALSKTPKKSSEKITLQSVDSKEHKRPEENLFLNEFTIDQLRDMAFWTWADGRIFLVNKEACRSLGYTKQELLSMSIPDIDVNFPADRLSEFIESNKYNGYVLMESRFKTKDGRTFPVEISSNYFFYDDKEYMVSLCRDITERKQAEETLRESEKKYRSLAEQVNDWVWEVDMNGTYSYASPRVRGLLGYEPDEMIGTSPFDYMAPEEAERVRALFAPIFEAQEEFSLLENTLVKKDGSKATVETSGVPIFDDRGTFIGYRGIDRDITERKWVEEALRESEEKYRIVADNTYDWEFWLSPGGDVLYTSPSCERITGYSAGELMKNPDLLFEIAHPEDKPAFLAHVHTQQPSSHGELEFRIIARSGEVRWVHHICQPIYDMDGHFLGIRGSNRDITKRKRAEEALRESEQKLRSFYDLPLIGMALTTLEKRWIYANDRICEILGYSIEELSSLTWDEITHPDDLDNDLEHFNRLLSGKIDHYTIEKRFVRKDGRIVHTQISIGCVRNPDNSVRYVAGVMQDITERKQVDESLRSNEKFLNGVFDGIQDGISVLDKDLNIIRVNKTMERWHFDMLPLVGKKCYYAYHCRSEPCEYCPNIKAMKEKIVHVNIVPREIAGKVEGWQEVYSYPLLDDRGDVIGVIDYVRDITERKRAEDAVRYANAYNRSLIEASLDPLITIAPDGKITDVNRATESATGILRDNLIGTDFSNYSTDPDMARKGYEKVFEEGSVTDYPLEIKHRDGRITPVIYNASVYRNEFGNVIGVFAAARDVTERKLAENALRNAKDQVELYVDLMGHDINNMNQVSMGFLELAHSIIEMEGQLREDNIVLLEKAMDSLRNSSQLIDNVRKLQREKMGLYEQEVLDVRSVIEDAIKQFRGIPGRDVRIMFGPFEDCHVRANSLLKDVFVNLVGNAIKHSRGSLSVNIDVRRVMDSGRIYCRVDVEDDGPGIPDQLKSTLFDRLSLTTTRARGKGFGLCLIKMLVDDYQGKFWVEDSVAGDHTKGARFVVMMPAVEK
jgi:PAS domain S-box-containing protein